MRNMRGLTTSVEHIVATISSQRGNDLLYSFSISSSAGMKLRMGFFIGGSLLRTKFDFVFVRLFRLKSDTFSSLAICVARASMFYRTGFN